MKEGNITKRIHEIMREIKEEDEADHQAGCHCIEELMIVVDKYPIDIVLKALTCVMAITVMELPEVSLRDMAPETFSNCLKKYMDFVKQQEEGN